jgi:hypothetical protein
MITLPRIVKNLFSQTVIDLSLIRVLGPSWDIIAIWISIKSIMRPETVIKSEILGIIVIIVYNRSWPVLYLSVDYESVPFQCSIGSHSLYR